VAICDRIFDELLNLGEIKISHTLQPNDEIKKHAYCKFHHSYSHSTNDCNSFHQQMQPDINEGCLVLHKMQVDQNPFPVDAFMNTIELIIPKVLIRPDQVEKARGKNIIIGEKRPDEKLSLEESSPRLQQWLQRLGARQFGKGRWCVGWSGHCLGQSNRVPGQSNRVTGWYKQVIGRSDRYFQKRWICSQEKGKAEF
jgi:hypothetical protein